MNRFSAKIFDEFIDDGSVTFYTSMDHVSELGAGQQLSMMVVADQVNIVGAGLTIWMEHSGDGIHFLSKYVDSSQNPIPLVNNVALNPEGATVLYAAESAAAMAAYGSTSPAPSAKYTRLALQILQKDGVNSAHLTITVTVRGSPDESEFADEDEPRLHMPAGEPGSASRNEAMIKELRGLAAESVDLHPTLRAVHLIQNLSPSSREHLVAMDRRMAALPHATRKRLIGMTVDSVKRVMALAGREGSSRPCCGDTTPPKSSCEKPGCAS